MCSCASSLRQVTCLAYSGQLCNAVFASEPANISNLGSAFLTVTNTTTYGLIIEPTKYLISAFTVRAAWNT